MEDSGEVRLPLEGIRVLELGYGIAAPVAARNLAQFGADVIRVESARRPDSLRLGGAGWLPPAFDQSVRRDTMPSLNFSSSDKRSIGLEIDHADGHAVFEQLVAAADVVITNISEDGLVGLGIAYDDIRALKPDIVYVTLPHSGRTDRIARTAPGVTTSRPRRASTISSGGPTGTRCRSGSRTPTTCRRKRRSSRCWAR